MNKDQAMVRRALRWSCGVVVSLSLALYGVDDGRSVATFGGDTRVVAAMPLDRSDVQLSPDLRVAEPSRSALAPVVADPFDTGVPAPVLLPITTAKPALLPPAPPTPNMSWRYSGQLTSPDNSHQVFLSRGQSIIPVEAGQRLDDGFVIEGITAENIRLRHAESGTEYLITLPGQAAPSSP